MLLSTVSCLRGILARTTKRIVAAAVIIGIIADDIYSGLYAWGYDSALSEANSPSQGFANGFPLDFDQNASVDPQAVQVGMWVTLNTTQISGLALLADQPITVNARIAIFQGNWSQAAYEVGLTFQDAQPVVNGTYRNTLPSSAVIPLTKSKDGTWRGNGTVWFPFQGNFLPQFTLGYLGKTYTLNEVVTDFALPIQPANTVGTNITNQANVFLAFVLVWFEILGSGVLNMQHYPHTRNNR